jgi:FlaA1/EpsC-like NDP-sugar epimerase
MFGLNGNRYRVLNTLFALIDSLLVFGACLIANYTGFGGGGVNPLVTEYPVLKIMLIVCVIQLAFYYFDLYDANTCRGRKRMLILMLEAIVASSVGLGVIYYFVPFLGMSREVFTLTLALSLVFTFLWRLTFIAWSETKGMKERVLIIGTGSLAMKIKKEISEKGYEGFDIVGFVDENRENIGENIGKSI